jgi:hypothetical protein
VDWLFALAVVVAVGFVAWDCFVRGRRGAALAAGVVAMLVLAGGGIARAVDAPAPLALTALLVGGVLCIFAERIDATGGHHR